MSVSATEPVFEELRAAAHARRTRCSKPTAASSAAGRTPRRPAWSPARQASTSPSFVAAIADGDPEAAAETIFAENLLGGTCARVCPVEVLCEGACVLPRGPQADRDRRAPALRHRRGARATARRFASRAPRNGRRVAVIGAGPAGLVCAGELARSGYAVTVFDERDEVGGLVRYAIAPYRQLERAAAGRGARARRARRRVPARHADRRRERCASSRDEADAVFLGVGMGADTDVALPGDDLAGVWESLPFIEALKTGRPPTVGDHVVVIGGGNTAIDVAREALRLGATTSRSSTAAREAEMPAYAARGRRGARGGRCASSWLDDPVRFLGTRAARGASSAGAMRLGEPDASGRRRPEPVPGSEFVAPRRHRRQGDRPAAARASSLELDRRARARPRHDRRRPTTGRRQPEVLRRRRRRNGGASVVEAVREAKLAARAIDEWLR